MVRRGRAISEDEALLFREAVKDAAPLPARRRKPRVVPKPQPPQPAPVPIAPARTAPRAAPPTAPEPVPAPLPALDHGAAAGVDKRTLERFKKGERAIDARLDLHGMTQDAAHAALLRFVAHAHGAGYRCLLIVTGKGREGAGILRAQVPRWLNEAATRPLLLAIQRARPQHGGDGALYVLLKRKR